MNIPRRLSLAGLGLLFVGILALRITLDSVCSVTAPADLSMARLLLLLATIGLGFLIGVTAWLLFLLALMRRRAWPGFTVALLSPLLALLSVVFPPQPFPCPGGPLYDASATGLIFKMLFFLALAFMIPLIVSASVSLSPTRQTQ